MKILEFEDRRPLRKKTASDRRFVAAVDQANQEIDYDETQLESKESEAEGKTFKNTLQTIIRLATHLNRELKDQDNFPEWVSEEIGAVESKMLTIMNYIISEKELAQGTLSEDADQEKDQWIVVRRTPGKKPEKVGGPYRSVKKARSARDKKDLEYGSAVHLVKKVGEDSSVLEAVRKLPLSEQDFESLKEVINHPIPATLASIYLQDLIEDDELDGQIADIESREPARDIRFLVVEWIKRVMPDQHHRFFAKPKFYNRTGTMSVVHGYDPHQYRGTNPAITGNAYGRF